MSDDLGTLRNRGRKLDGLLDEDNTEDDGDYCETSLTAGVTDSVIIPSH